MNVCTTEWVVTYLIFHPRHQLRQQVGRCLPHLLQQHNEPACVLDMAWYTSVSLSPHHSSTSLTRNGSSSSGGIGSGGIGGGVAGFDD